MLGERWHQCTRTSQNEGLARRPLCPILQGFLCYWEVWDFFPNHLYLALAGVFYCSSESVSNRKILHNSDTVTTPLICGSWKAGGSAYFFHPLLLINFIAASTSFRESAFVQKDYLLVHLCKGNYFLFLKHSSLLKSWITLSKYPVYVNKRLIKRSP